MKPIKLIANIENHGEAGYVAWIDSIKGLVVEGGTHEEVCRELFISLKTKLAYDLGIKASEVQEITEAEYLSLKRELALRHEEKICKKEISLTLS